MKLHLTYSHENLRRPVLAEVIAKTGILINILEARVTPQSAEMVVDVPATGAEVQQIISSLTEAGLKVKQITKFVEFESDKCISCGACVSICPVGAIIQDKDWQVHMDETKCIGCRICIRACPLHVIEVF